VGPNTKNLYADRQPIFVLQYTEVDRSRVLTTLEVQILNSYTQCPETVTIQIFYPRLLMSSGV